MMMIRVVLVFFLVVALATATTSGKGGMWDNDNDDEPKQCANAPGLWDNFFTNLDRMFWRPWLDKYRVIRYAGRSPFAGPAKGASWPEGPLLSQSCLQLGLTHLSSVALIHWTAWGPARFGPPNWLLDQLAIEAPTRYALISLRACDSTTWADNPTLTTLMNVTLQREARCAFATKALRCALGNLYWVLSYASIALFVLILSAIFLFFGSLLCCCFCWSSVGSPDEESTEE